QGHDAAAVLAHQRQEGLGHRLERVGAGLEGRLHALPGGAEEVAAQGVRRGVGDGVDEAVEPAPTLLQGSGNRLDLAGIVDVHLQQVGDRVHAPGAALGQAHGPAEAGEHDLGALALGEVGDGEGDAGRREDAADEYLLALQDHREDTSVWRRRMRAEVRRPGGGKAGFEEGGMTTAETWDVIIKVAGVGLTVVGIVGAYVKYGTGQRQSGTWSRSAILRSSRHTPKARD